LKFYVQGDNGETVEWSLGISGADWTIDLPNNESYITSSPVVTLFSSQLPINGGWGGGMFRFSSNPMKKGKGQIFILEKKPKKES